MQDPTLKSVQKQLAEFASRRDWQSFHSPKNLAMALVAEAGELVEHFQWLTEEQSRALPGDTRQQVALELADILIYMLRMADVLNIDLLASTLEKISINEERFPVETVKGRALRGREVEEELKSSNS